MDIIKRAKLCLDTYALVEMVADNRQFADLFRTPFVIPDLALAELYSLLLQRHGKEKADEWFSKFEIYGIPIPNQLLVRAVAMRRQHKETHFSLTDTAGYVLARHLGLPFVTGDQGFKGMDGVDFRSAQTPQGL